jgi:geranylgeranyl pyrophosphate synthase
MAAHKLDSTQQKMVIDRLALELRRNNHQAAITQVLAYLQEHAGVRLTRSAICYYRRTHADAIADIQEQQKRRAAQKRFARLVCPSPDLLPIA